MNTDDALIVLRAAKPQLQRLGVKHLYLFGSLAVGKASDQSDVDVMADLDEGPDGRKALFSAFDLGAVQYELTQILGKRVDLVVRADALKPGHKLSDVARNRLLDVF
jgi:hypothetical protein